MPKTEVKSPSLSSSGGTPSPRHQLHQKQPIQQQNAQQHMQSSSNTANNPPEGRKISCEDIQLVQNLIERCLQLYMNKIEVINTLLHQAKIEPGFTGLVWQKLEEQNPDFFKAYYVRLKLKKQIILFNHFLEQHAQLTQKVHTVKAPLPVLQNGLHSSAVHHMQIGYPVPHQPPPHAHFVPLPVPSPSPAVVAGTPVADGFVVSHKDSGSNNLNPEMPLLSPSSSIPINGDTNIVANAALQQGNTNFPFSGVGNPTDMTGMGMDIQANFPADASFHPTENHPQNGMGNLQIPSDADAGGGRESIGFLSHLPRNFSLSDLTAELSSSTDILGSYIGSPFLPPDGDAFLHSSDDEKMLDEIGDPSAYDDFEDTKPL